MWGGVADEEDLPLDPVAAVPGHLPKRSRDCGHNRLRAVSTAIGREGGQEGLRSADIFAEVEGEGDIGVAAVPEGDDPIAEAFPITCSSEINGKLPDAFLDLADLAPHGTGGVEHEDDVQVGGGGDRREADDQEWKDPEW